DRATTASIGAAPTMRIEGVFPSARLLSSTGAATCVGETVVLARADDAGSRQAPPPQTAALAPPTLEGRRSGAGQTYKVSIDVTGQKFAGTIECDGHGWPVSGTIEAPARIRGAMTLQSIQKQVTGDFPNMFIWSGGTFSPLAYTCGTGEVVALTPT